MHSRVSILQRYALIFILSFATLAFRVDPAQPAQGQGEIQLHQFDMLTALSGWVLLDHHLYWTSDAGQTWDEISPTIPSDAVIQDVHFIDSNIGWILLSAVAPDGSTLFQLAHTIDHGGTWTLGPLPLFDSGEIASYAEKAEMGWSDAQTGWISVKQISGSNFSIGTLFRTSDGGATWNRFTLPVADNIDFSDPQIGWAIGGPTGGQIFRTQNGGVTWQSLKPESIPANTSATAYMPYYSSGQGLLVMTSLGLENALGVYSLEYPSNQWLLAEQVSLDVQPGLIGLSIIDSKNFVAAIPGTASIIHMMDGELGLIDNRDGLSASIVNLDMVSLDIGWAKSVESSCVTGSSLDDEPASVSCSSSTRLLHTTDGGMTWQSLNLPLVESDVISIEDAGMSRAVEMSAASSAGNTEILIGQGFDICEIPTVQQLQTWWNSSPYQSVNLYIGGSSRACANNVLAASYLQQLYQQGWKFIPTWVGPQAPCTGYLSRMSSNPTTAYSQGVDQANLAVERLAELELTNPDKTGSVVYYDIEYYGTDSACRNAVNSFMNGWVSQLHARGNLAGVYGSTLCNTGLSDFRTITNVPDVIWPARWYHNAGSGAYDPNATVWDLGSCLPNTVWANHQRIRQYEGDHNETWGNLTLGIDNNVLDGVVAIPYIFPFVSGIVRADDNPTSAVSVDFTVTFSESVMDVEAVDFALTTAGVIGASIIDVSGSDHIYTVTVNTGSGNGTLRLDIPVTADITDLDGDTLGGLPFAGGETYTIDKTPTAASLVSPSGSIGANYNPVYTWNEVPSATWYYLWVNGPNGNIIKHWVEASTGCNSGTCSVTPSATLSGGAHTWWIQTWNPAGYGPWSLGKEFSTLSLGAATLTSPNGNIGTTYAPSFSWDHVPGTTWYYVWVNGPSGNVVKKWYESSTICSAGTCTTASPTTLGGGNHTWWVRTWNSAGYGPWSSGMNFNTTIPTIPTAATLVSPTGSGGLNPPTYTWNKVTGVTWYYVWVNSSSGNVFKQWYEASAVCGASTCSVTQPSSLANGSYVWWVQTWNSAGYGPWSSSMNFSIP